MIKIIKKMMNFICAFVGVVTIAPLDPLQRSVLQQQE
jgi:hypothetical protein